MVEILIGCEELGLRRFRRSGDPNIILSHSVAGLSAESVDLCVVIDDSIVIDVDGDETIEECHQRGLP